MNASLLTYTISGKSKGCSRTKYKTTGEAQNASHTMKIMTSIGSIFMSGNMYKNLSDREEEGEWGRRSI